MLRNALRRIVWLAVGIAAGAPGARAGGSGSVVRWLLQVRQNQGGPLPAVSRELLWYPAMAADDGQAEYERQLVDLINQERGQRGLPVLETDPLLTRMAREHSGEMRERGFFAHTSPTPGRREPQDRYLLHFPRFRSQLAENIARMAGGWGKALHAAHIAKSHADLMASPGHCANILREGVTRVGVGIAANAQGDYWITENFAGPP